MPTVILTCGLTFSGKTTVAKRIASEFGCDYLSLDDINDVACGTGTACRLRSGSGHTRAPSSE